MSLEHPPRHLTTTDLARLCEQETGHYFQHRSHDPRYCFELFRRAIQEGDQSAWERICTQYEALVTGWVKQHHGFEATGEEALYFVNGAFARIAGNLTADKFGGFTDLGYLLRYLKMCVHSVIVDYNRSAERAPRQASMEDLTIEVRTPDPAVEETVSDRVNNQALWEWINARLHDQKERLVVEGIFVLELKPREIYEHSPTVFGDVDEIYQIKQNVLARLRRDPELLKLLEADD